MKKLLYLLLLLIIVYSCKKKPSYTVSPAITEAKISRVAIIDSYRNKDTILYRISYDQQGRVDSMLITYFNGYTPDTTIKIFAYDNGYYTINFFHLNWPYVNRDNDRIDVNGDGTISHRNKINFLYNNNRQILFVDDSVYATGSGGISYFMRVDRSEYQWDKNGNCTGVDIDNTHYHISYDVTRQGQTADCGRINTFLGYGQPVIITANLPTTIINNSQQDCNYRYDNLGRIIQLGFPGYTYKYEYY